MDDDIEPPHLPLTHFLVDAGFVAGRCLAHHLGLFLHLLRQLVHLILDFCESFLVLVVGLFDFGKLFLELFHPVMHPLCIACAGPAGPVCPSRVFHLVLNHVE